MARIRLLRRDAEAGVDVEIESNHSSDPKWSLARVSELIEHIGDFGGVESIDVVMKTVARADVELVQAGR